MSRLERIVSVYGGRLLNNGRQALIPGPGHSAKDRSVSLIETDDGRILIHCFSPRDDWRSVRRALAERGLLDASYAGDARRAPPARICAQPVQEERVSKARRLWSESQPIGCSAAFSYLRNRAIACARADDDGLRFHPRMTSLDDCLRRPALIAALRNQQGEVQGVQVTLLTSHGDAKASVLTPRRVIGQLMGGAVQLGAAKDELAIGEGVETMLSAANALGLPSWALLTAGNLQIFTPPLCVKRLVIAADSDAAGLAAAETLKTRLATAIRVELALPPDNYGDWNDFARGRMRAP